MLIANSWWHGTVLERRSLAGELCARPAADRWPVIWVNRPLQVSELGLVWLIGAVVCSLAAYRESSCSLAHAMDGRISAAAPLALADQLPLRWL